MTRLKTIGEQRDDLRREQAAGLERERRSAPWQRNVPVPAAPEVSFLDDVAYALHSFYEMFQKAKEKIISHRVVGVENRVSDYQTPGPEQYTEVRNDLLKAAVSRILDVPLLAAQVGLPPETDVVVDWLFLFMHDQASVQEEFYNEGLKEGEYIFSREYVEELRQVTWNGSLEALHLATPAIRVMNPNTEWGFDRFPIANRQSDIPWVQESILYDLHENATVLFVGSQEAREEYFAHIVQAAYVADTFMPNGKLRSHGLRIRQIETPNDFLSIVQRIERVEDIDPHQDLVIIEDMEKLSAIMLKFRVSDEVTQMKYSLEKLNSYFDMLLSGAHSRVHVFAGVEYVEEGERGDTLLQRFAKVFWANAPGLLPHQFTDCQDVFWVPKIDRKTREKNSES